MLLSALLAFPNNAISQLKVGIVNIETIITQMPEAQKADKELKDLGKKYSDTLAQLKSDLEQAFQQYQKQKGMMPAAEQQKEEEKLQAMQMQYMQYQEEKFGQTGEMSALRENYLLPIREKIKEAIEKVSKTEKLNIVLDKTSPALLYSEEKFDITFRVLDEIKRGNEGGN